MSLCLLHQNSPCYCCTDSPLTWLLTTLKPLGPATVGLISPDDNRTNPSLPRAIPSQLFLSLPFILHDKWVFFFFFFDNHWIVLLSPKQCKFLFFSPKPRWREEGLGTELELCQMTDPAFPTPFPDTELLGLIPSGVSEPVCKAEFCVLSPKL